jgi:hypothetical protein
VRKLFTKMAFVALSLIAMATPKAFARGQYFNYIQQGGAMVITSGQQSRTKVQRSFPGATIKVCIVGTSCSASGGTLATLFSDSGGTPKANPFTASTDGSFTFWIDLTSFDVVAYGPGITTQCGSPSQLPCIAAFTWPNQSIGGGGGSSSSTVFNVKDYGAKGDLRTVTDGAIPSGSSTLTSATAAFTTSDVGKEVEVAGAGVAGVTLYTTISSLVSTTQIHVALSASTTVSGATTKIYTDDGIDIGLAQAAQQSNGRGTLYFPPGIYGTYGKDTPYTFLGVYTSVSNVNMQCDGCTIYISGEHMSSASGVAFSFTATTDVTIDGFKVTGEVTTALIVGGGFHGIKFLEFLHDCKNINVPRLTAIGIGVPIEFNNNTTGVYDGLPHTKGVHIGLLDVSTGIYGLASQYSMDDAVIDMLRTDNVTRSLFIYGSVNVTANIHAKDAHFDDVKLWGVAGIGLTNISINYYSGAESLSRANSGNFVTLDFLGPTPVTHRNISVHFDVTYAGSGVTNTGSSWFQVNKYTANGSSFDTVDRGHILDGLTLSGNITNYPNDGGICGAEIPSPNSKWGPTLDSWYNIHLSNLSLLNAKCVRLGLAALKGPVLVDNFYSDQSFSTLILQQDDYIGAPDLSFPVSGGPITILNSNYANQYAVAGSDVPSGIVYVNGTINVTAGVGSQKQWFYNSGCGGTCTVTIPSAVVGRRFGFARTNAQSFRAAPQAADQIRGASAANKYVQLDANGTSIELICYSAGFWDILYYSSTANVSFQP